MFPSPCLAGNSLAFPSLAIEIGGSSILDGSLLFREVGRIQERFIEQLLLPEHTSNRLVVRKLGQLKQEGVEDGGLGLFFGLLLLAELIVKKMHILRQSSTRPSVRPRSRVPKRHYQRSRQPGLCRFQRQCASWLLGDLKRPLARWER